MQNKMQGIGMSPQRKGRQFGCSPPWWSKAAGVDIGASLAVAGLLVPEGMAYAGIAGLPPQVSLSLTRLLIHFREVDFSKKSLSWCGFCG